MKLSDNERRVLHALAVSGDETIAPELRSRHYIDPVLSSNEGIHQSAASLVRKGLAGKRHRAGWVWLVTTAAGDAWLDTHGLLDTEYYEAEFQLIDAGDADGDIPVWYVVRRNRLDSDRDGDVIADADTEEIARLATHDLNAGRPCTRDGYNVRAGV